MVTTAFLELNQGNGRSDTVPQDPEILPFTVSPKLARIGSVRISLENVNTTWSKTWIKRIKYEVERNNEMVLFEIYSLQNNIQY